jgi:hypothetical protein
MKETIVPAPEGCQGSTKQAALALQPSLLLSRPFQRLDLCFLPDPDNRPQDRTLPEQTYLQFSLAGKIEKQKSRKEGKKPLTGGKKHNKPHKAEQRSQYVF